MAICCRCRLLAESVVDHFLGYHGNTDSAVAFFLMLCVWLLSKEKLLGAATALGVSFWIKLPGLLALPVLLVVIPDWRKRFRFLAVSAAIALASYVPALIQDPVVVWKKRFRLSRPNFAHDCRGAGLGPRVLLFSIIASPTSLAGFVPRPDLILPQQQLAFRARSGGSGHVAAPE